MKTNQEIASEAAEIRTRRTRQTPEEMKSCFDVLIVEMEKEIYELYKKYEREYTSRVLKTFIDNLMETERPKLEDVGMMIARHNELLNDFFLSLSQSRKSRAGKAFEDIHNELFKRLGYPFDEQVPIDGKPDFVMPSKKHYDDNPLDCIVFTAKRTVRERWKQIVTEGSKGMGFFLATIDRDISQNQLREMMRNRIYLVVPKNIKDEFYADAKNVFSFSQFFRDKLDPALQVWRRNGVA